MAFTDKYPYTDFHELNLDWFLQEFKKVTDKVTDLDTTVQQFTDFVTNYFDNLDVQEEINRKLDVMAADGTLEALLQPFLDEYNTEIINQNARILTLEGRMDQFATLAEGSTTGDAELMDARVGADGYTWPSAGDAIRGQVSYLKGDIENMGFNITEKEFVPAYTLTTGYRIGNTFSVIADASYEISDYIPLLPGQLIRITATGQGTSIAHTAVYDRSLSADYMAMTFGSVSGTFMSSYLNKTDDIQYVRACGTIADGISIKIFNYWVDQKILIDDILVQNIFIKNDDTFTIGRLDSSGYIANYVCTVPLKLKKGETVTMYARVSTSIPAVIKCDKNGGNRSIVVAGNNVTRYMYIADEDCYVMLQYKMDDTFNNIGTSPSWNDNADNKDTRHAVISFIFDDGNVNDGDIADVFKEYGFKCGFALISSIVTNARSNVYLKLQDEGFSMLSHSTDATAMNDPTEDPDVINGKLLTSKQLLTKAGFDIRGWVTPSSVMDASFRHLLFYKYNYGFTVYYGNYQPGVPAYNTFSDSPYNLFRLSLYSQTSDIETAIDEAISNQGLLTIYFHGADWASAYETRLRDVLDYIVTKMNNYYIKCLAPNEAFDYFYSVRKQDL